MKSIKIAALCSLGFAALFSAFSLVFYFGDWSRLAFVFGAGLFVGLVGAPEFEPGAFKNAWVVQLFGGAVAGGLGALAVVVSGEAVILGVLLGGTLGWLAPFWAKHINIP